MKKVLIWVVVVLVFSVAFIAFLRSVKMNSTGDQAASNEPGPLDDFATCLKDKGLKFYGAFWCPHCQAQKALFGSSAHLLPYIECSTPDAQNQTPVCVAQEIKSYPTWEFPDGTKQTGEMELATLSEKSSCPLPGDTTSATSTTVATTTTP